MKRDCPPGGQEQRNRQYDNAIVQGKIDKIANHDVLPLAPIQRLSIVDFVLQRERIGHHLCPA